MSPAEDGRVLLVASNFPPVRGGSPTVYDNLARCAGGRVVVLAPRVAYADGLPLIGWREHDRRAGYTVHRLPLLRTTLRDPEPRGRLRLIAADLWIRARLVAAILRLLRRERCAAVCVGELLANTWLIATLRLITRARLIAYVHGEEITTRDPYQPDPFRGLRAAHGIVVVSRFTQRAVTDLLGPQAQGKIRLIENGVDGRRFKPGPRRPDLSARFRLDGTFVFVSVCRLLEKKGIDHAIQAFAGLTADYPDCRYLVVGTGPYHAHLERLANELGLAGRVAFAGQVAEEDLVDHYRLGDVFVMPNRELPNGDTEGFGLVFLEANSCGLPAIAGRDGGSTDAVADGVNGLIVDGHSVPAIGQAMRRMLEQPALREGLRAGGLATAAAVDWSMKVQAFLAFCHEPSASSAAAATARQAPSGGPGAPVP